MTAVAEAVSVWRQFASKTPGSRPWHSTCSRGVVLKALFAAFLLIACAVSPAAAQLASVTGIVIDHRTEQAIPRVLVYVEGHPVFETTDGNGRFALALPAGQYTIAASVIGYALLRASIDVAAGSVVPVTFRMSE